MGDDEFEALFLRAWAVMPGSAREDLRRIDAVVRPFYEAALREQAARGPSVLERLIAEQKGRK